MHKNKKSLLFCSIAFNYHDSSVTFSIGRKVILVLEAERVFRKKKMQCTSREMEQLIMYGLHLIKKTPNDVSYWALTTLQNPWLDKKDTYPNPPTWKKIKLLNKERDCLIINHHLAHASSFLFSPFKDALIFSCDGGGDYGERVAVYSGKNESITKEKFDVSSCITAKPYDLCSTYLYKKPKCEGRLMALAAYGEPSAEYIKRLEHLLPVLCIADYKTGGKILLKSFPELQRDVSIKNKNICNFAAALQHVFVKHRLNDIQRVIKRYQPSNLVLVGGACLNLEVNTKIQELYPDFPMFIPPCCDDTGQSLGAIAYLIAETFKKRPIINLPYIGYGDSSFSYSHQTIKRLVDALLNNEILLIHNHKAEIGPRSLGNRSFFARPDSMNVKKILSQEIKKRESYRPVAPITLEEKVHTYFYGPKRSPYMLDQYKIKPGVSNKIIGSVHYDGTARVQTVSRKDNPFIYDLIKSFGKKSGKYVLLNTSLNLQGEPIANIKEDTLDISKRIEQKHKIVYNGKIIK